MSSPAVWIKTKGNLADRMSRKQDDEWRYIHPDERPSIDVDSSHHEGLAENEYPLQILGGLTRVYQLVAVLGDVYHFQHDSINLQVLQINNYGLQPDICVVRAANREFLIDNAKELGLGEIRVSEDGHGKFIVGTSTRCTDISEQGYSITVSFTGYQFSSEEAVSALTELAEEVARTNFNNVSYQLKAGAGLVRAHCGLGPELAEVARHIELVNRVYRNHGHFYKPTRWIR